MTDREEAVGIARTCLRVAALLAEQSNGPNALSWPVVREAAQSYVIYLASAKPAVEGFPACAKAVKVLTEMVVAIDIGFVVDPGDPHNHRPRIADRDRPCTVKLPEGFEKLREEVEATALSDPGPGRS